MTSNDEAALVQQIESLLALDAKAALAPHGVGGLARELLTKAAAAIERGKAEQDKAVAAERERLCDCDKISELAQKLKDMEDRAEAAEAKLARLENPDEALVEAVAEAISIETEANGCASFVACPFGHDCYCRAEARVAIASLAVTLTGQEGENTDG